MSSRIVLIGPADSLPGLKKRLDAKAEVQQFTDGEALEALDHIIRSKPQVIAMHGEFSRTSRGTALINRIKDDPKLTACEVRVLTHDVSPSRAASKRKDSGVRVAVVEEAKPALDRRGTRRSARIRIRDGVEVSVDGSAATLVDLSSVGAQVISPNVLKPNQRVRIVMGDGKAAIKCSGAIAWASFEMPKGMATRYRAGIDFGSSADAHSVDAFAKKNRRNNE